MVHSGGRGGPGGNRGGDGGLTFFGKREFNGRKGRGPGGGEGGALNTPGPVGSGGGAGFATPGEAVGGAQGGIVYGNEILNPFFGGSGGAAGLSI
jgi:hypothetical protein